MNHFKLFWRTSTTVLALSFFLFFTIRYILPTFAQPQPTKTPKFGIFFPPTITSTPTPTNTPTPTPTRTPTPTIPANTEPTLNPIPSQRVGFYYYSQRDPRWLNYPNPGAGSINIGRCGCGETSASMILTELFDRSLDPSNGPYSPPRVWDLYDSFWPGRCGTGPTNHKQVFQSLGLYAEIYGYAGPMAVLNYLRSGYQVMLYYDRDTTGTLGIGQGQSYEGGHIVAVAPPALSVYNYNPWWQNILPKPRPIYAQDGEMFLVYDPWPFTNPQYPQPSNIEVGVTIVSYLVVKKI